MSSFDLAAVLKIPELPAYLLQVDQKMDKFLISANPYLRKSARRVVAAKSKRLRPSLVIAVAASQGVKINSRVITGCAAVELVHIGSLVHDDIIDNASTRRTVRTINAQEGLNQAIMAGDYMLAKACSAATDINSEAAQIIASTFAELCNGESLELMQLYNTDRSINNLLKVIDGKSAALISSACQIGGLCAELSPSQIDKLARFGRQLGMAFQLIDDVLDFISAPQLIGKPTANDVKEGVYTMPIILSLRGPRGKTVKALLKEPRDSYPKLISILLDDGSIAKTILEAKKYNSSAISELKKVNASKRFNDLLSLPDEYLRWALGNLVAKQYRSTISKILG